jgi:hypothetical protein
MNEKIGLDIVFPNPELITKEKLKGCLTTFHSMLHDVKVESITDQLSFYQICWGNHDIRFFSSDVSLPTEVLDQCVSCANYDDSIKDEIYSHQSHAIAYHQEDDSISTREKYVALSLIAAALASVGAIAVINENANSSLPVMALIPEDQQDILEYLTTMPLPILFCGSVTIQIEGAENLIMRTYGAEYFGLPNLAKEFSPMLPENPIYLFADIFDYCLATGNKPPFNSSEHGDHMISFRSPREDEYYLIDPNSETLVLESS